MAQWWLLDLFSMSLTYTTHKLSQIDVCINQNVYSMIRFNYDKIDVSKGIDVNK